LAWTSQLRNSNSNSNSNSTNSSAYVQPQQQQHACGCVPCDVAGDPDWKLLDIDDVLFGGAGKTGGGVFVAGVWTGVGRGFLRQVGSVCAVSYFNADAAVPCLDACLNAALAPPGTYERHL
jgi:hypothetical protein